MLPKLRYKRSSSWFVPSSDAAEAAEGYEVLQSCNASDRMSRNEEYVYEEIRGSSPSHFPKTRDEPAERIEYHHLAKLLLRFIRQHIAACIYK